MRLVFINLHYATRIDENMDHCVVADEVCRMFYRAHQLMPKISETILILLVLKKVKSPTLVVNEIGGHLIRLRQSFSL